MMATTSFASVANANPHTIPNTGNPSPPQSYSPHTPPSANISPTNYYPHLHVRQLRPPKQPLYTPACLRPTDSQQGRDIPERPTPPYTPPQSKENSFDSGKSGFGLAALPMSLPSPEGDAESLRRGLSRAGSQVVDEDLGDVTGPPTMAHWKPNESALACAVCQTAFTWYFRKHHCRHCGDVVCGSHLSNTVPLDQNARYHPNGVISKACDFCFREWRTIKKLRHSRTSSLADSMTSSQGTTKAPALPIPQHARTEPGTQVGSMARSEGMVWSTF